MQHDDDANPTDDTPPEETPSTPAAEGPADESVAEGLAQELETTRAALDDAVAECADLRRRLAEVSHVAREYHEALGRAYTTVALHRERSKDQNHAIDDLRSSLISARTGTLVAAVGTGLFAGFVGYLAPRP